METSGIFRELGHSDGVVLFERSGDDKLPLHERDPGLLIADIALGTVNIVDEHDRPDPAATLRAFDRAAEAIYTQAEPIRSSAARRFGCVCTAAKFSRVWSVANRSARSSGCGWAR